MVYSPEFEVMSSKPPSARTLAPAIGYYIRKLLRQNLDQLACLESGLANGAICDPLIDDLNIIIANRCHTLDEINSTVEQLEHLGLIHQTISSHGARHTQKLRETEEKLFLLLGFTRSSSDEDCTATILLVDVSPHDQRSLAEMLHRHHYRVRNVVDVTQALSAVKEHTPDLVLFDDAPEGVDLYKICGQLKTDDETREIPVIFLSEDATAKAKVKAFRVGASDYVVEPYQIEELLVRIEHQLNLRQLQRRLEEQNIRAQQEMQERRQADERYRSIVENSLDGIFQTTPDGHYLSANTSLAKMYGYDSPEELIKGVANISESIYVEPGRRETINARLQQFGQVFAVRSEIYRRDRTKIWISENVREVKDNNGNLIYYEGTVRNITDRKQIEAQLAQQRQETEQLLLNIVPASVAERMKQRRNQLIADRFENVTVLFADIDNFTAFSSRMAPTDQVVFLNRLVSMFDRLTEQFGVEKIKTIRDTYLVASGLPDPREDHAEVIAELALAMQQVVCQFQMELGGVLQLRIGVSSGSVIAGVIGTKKMTYDLWGDTVNLASRMQGCGQAGRIHVSPTAYRHLAKSYSFEQRPGLEIPGMGKMSTYFLKGKIFKG
jgi:adenylate cyclase